MSRSGRAVSRQGLFFDDFFKKLKCFVQFVQVFFCGRVLRFFIRLKNEYAYEFVNGILSFAGWSAPWSWRLHNGFYCDRLHLKILDILDSVRGKNQDHAQSCFAKPPPPSVYS